MTRGRTITFRYKHFKYDDNINKMLSISLTPKDEERLIKIYNNYESLGIRRGYEYIIKDLYILLEKYSVSTTDIAKIYDVGIRTVQIWLKELGLNRTLKEAQQIAVTKRDYKTVKSPSKGIAASKIEVKDKVRNYITVELNRLLAERFNNYEVIVGIDALGVINSKRAIPIIVAKNTVFKKFLIDFVELEGNEEELDKTKKVTAEKMGYKLLLVKHQNLNDEKEIDHKLMNLFNEITRELEGI